MQRKRESNPFLAEVVGGIAGGAGDAMAEAYMSANQKKISNSVGIGPNVAELQTRPGTPRVATDLGCLCRIVLDPASARSRIVRLLAIGGTSDGLGDRALSFNSRSVRLVGDGNGDLHITRFYQPLPEALERGRSYFLGAVVGLTRRDSLGDLVPHLFAEHGGEYPKLHYKDGFLFFRGGTYSLTPRGLEG